ncbi:DUF302 domain-containing protein [Reichenbachiella ulvae]|uniref:DUF302 domain-containing protein n=1 Tax=Reichenbachiella ulvae TaxID=2980104 RepID=A0ABT3CSA1_9BACT|nr:DUF302 domain-containing protein [Reichenbachiella ulvae]MCV9386586.1 DUF302 domain-containing protein [Reichenbachiella ulvae]
MKYYYDRSFDSISFDEAIEKVTASLKDQGFGVLTEIDIQATLKKKLNEDFRPYRILGACNPPYALKALSAEDMIGAMLPCNVVVQEKDGKVIVAAIDPVASMQAVDNEALAPIATEIREKLKVAIDNI